MDPYSVLGVNRDTPIEAVKETYHKLILEWHPDKNKSSQAAEKFRCLREAWETLSDVEKKTEYHMSRLSEKVLMTSTDVPFSEMSCMDGVLSKNCRCGHLYEITIQDFEEGYNVVECPGCSLCITIV